MQKRVEPAAFASRACARISSSSISGSRLNPVGLCSDCAQYLQSSGQAPVRIESRLQSCTSRGLWLAR